MLREHTDVRLRNSEGRGTGIVEIEKAHNNVIIIPAADTKVVVMNFAKVSRLRYYLHVV